MKKRLFSLVLSCTIVLTLLVPFTALFSSVSAGAVNYTADPTWYDANKSILEINDIPDFVAFMEKMNELGTTDNGSSLNATGNLAAISWSGKMPFEGQTILLNTDIVLNPGITFSTSGPSDSSAYKFIRDSKQIGFGGIFDGQGHTISGLYISSTKGGAGSIFGVGGAATKQTNVVVRNLQIKNSFIENSSAGVASIFSSAAFNSHVLIENIYSEAILKSNQTSSSTDGKLKISIIGVNVGGFCATVGGDLTIVNSVYEGQFVTKDTTAPKKYIGGMVGNITMKELNDGHTYMGSLTVENSAYYGKYEGNAVYTGKLSGDQTAGTKVVVNNSIFGGTLDSTATATIPSDASKNASTYYVGRLIGLCTSNYSINVSKSVATSVYRNSTPAGNYNYLETSSDSSLDVTVIVENNLTTATLSDTLSSYWVAQGTRGKHPVPASYISLFGAESLKHDYVNELPITANDLFERLGVKLANDGIYTEDSYRYYSDAYDDIVDAIYAEGADLSKINVDELRANAESKLLTHVDQKRIELKGLLGAKATNASSYYTASSYEQYSSAYDAIVKSLDDANTVEALEKIDVTALKTEAEAKLVVYVPGPEPDSETNAPETNAPETNAPETNAPETNAPETDAPETDAPETDAPETDAQTPDSSETATEGDVIIVANGCGGCDSAAAISAIALVGGIGVAFVIKRKKD